MTREKQESRWQVASHLLQRPVLAPLPLLSTVRYCLLLFAIARYCPLLSVNARYCPLLPITVRYRASLSINVRYCPLLSVIVRSTVLRRGFDWSWRRNHRRHNWLRNSTHLITRAAQPRVDHRITGLAMSPTRCHRRTCAPATPRWQWVIVFVPHHALLVRDNPQSAHCPA